MEYRVQQLKLGHIFKNLNAHVFIRRQRIEDPYHHFIAFCAINQVGLHIPLWQVCGISTGSADSYMDINKSCCNTCSSYPVVMDVR